MKALQHNEIFGNWATLFLATDKQGQIDFSRLADEIDILISSKPNGIYSNGTAGEFYTQTENEFDKISGLLAEKCGKENIPFQIGVNHMSAQISMERLKRTKDLNPSAFQVILPDWFPTVQEENIEFLQKMSEEAGNVGLVLYNPPHAKVVLQPEQWKPVKKVVPRLVGLKVFDNNGNDNWYKRAGNNSNGLSVFIPGHHLATGIKNGANGAYSNMACLNPFAAQKWYDLIIENIEAGLELEIRINKFMQQFINPLITEEHYPNQACDRFLALVGGWADIGSHMRWPYRSVPSEYADKIRKEAKKIIPEFFEISA
jgi:4-hydroxy-tetrahydrodipicolinate synthase